MSTAFLTTLETRLEFSIAGTATLLRLFCRYKYGGVKSWGLDDLFAVLALVFYAIMVVGIELVVKYGAAAGFTTEMRAALTPAMRESFEKGEIVMFASFYDLMLLNWSLKGSLLAYYARLTQDTRWNLYIKIVAVYAVVTFVAAVLTETFHCMPIHKNWQVWPNPGMECSAGIITNIVIAVGNTTTDALLLVVPFFLLKDLQISLFRKFKIALLMSLGGVVICFSLLRCIETVSNPQTVMHSSVWATRELFVATMAINAPIIHALFRKETWTKSKTGSDYYYDSNQRSKEHGTPQYRGNFSHGSGKKNMEIYKMTDIETSSKESTKELVEEEDRNLAPSWPRGAVAPMPYSSQYPKGSIV